MNISKEQNVLTVNEAGEIADRMVRVVEVHFKPNTSGFQVQVWHAVSQTWASRNVICSEMQAEALATEARQAIFAALTNARPV